MRLNANKRFLWFICICIIFSLLSCTTDARKDLLCEIAETPAKNLQSYEFDKTSSLISRVKPAPDFVVSFWNKTDKRTDYSSYTPSKGELMMIDGYIAKLPRHIKAVLQDRLVAIYFINNLVGSGITDDIFDQSGALYTVMLFNPASLKTDLSTWLTYRENTCFQRDAPDVKVEINCGTEYTGFLYALTHESAHVVDYVESHTPYITKNTKILQQITTNETAFVKDRWVDLETPSKPYDFESRKSITFYRAAESKIKISDASRLYEHLMATPFVSLYGSVSWSEDFAESVMFYHLTQVLRQPYEIRLIKNAATIQVFRPMESAKVKEKFPLLQNLY